MGFPLGMQLRRLGMEVILEKGVRRVSVKVKGNGLRNLSRQGFSFEN